MKLKESQQTVVVLANAAELVRSIAQEVMGNDVADTFEGSPLSRGILYNLAQTEFQSSVSKYVAGAV